MRAHKSQGRAEAIITYKEYQPEDLTVIVTDASGAFREFVQRDPPEQDQPVDRPEAGAEDLRRRRGSHRAHHGVPGGWRPEDRQGAADVGYTGLVLPGARAADPL
jgi:hypothetical protein